LLAAVSYYLWDNVKLLVENGADVNLTHDSMWTPLAASLVSYDIEMAKYLIDHGADFNNLKFWTKTVALDENKRPIRNSYGDPIMINRTELNILDLLRTHQFSLDSEEYKIKMEVVRFLQIRGLDYWKYPIPEDVRNEHKDDPEYLSKY
jgi:ankyrin repeat protein